MISIRRIAAPLAAALAAGGLIALAAAQTPPQSSPPVRTAMSSASFAWWAPGEGKPFTRQVDYFNDAGMVRTLLLNGPMETAGHPFFTAIGTNGRACITCHQPADAMSLSAATAQARWADTNGTDPLFAAVDGSNCPTLPQAERASHSLLLEHGLIRVEREWPPRNAAGQNVTPDFRLEVVRDPNGCNSGRWGPTGSAHRISVYRRPRPATNLKYLIASGFAYDPKDGMPLDIDPETGRPSNANLLADARVYSLEGQARDAMRTHLGVNGAVDEAAVRQIVDFELRLSTAQQMDGKGGALDGHGAQGGPMKLETSQAGQLASYGVPIFSEFAAWERLPTDANIGETQRVFRESVARGAKIFRDRTFLISDSAGINSPIGFGNPVRNSCSFCHNMAQMGNDVAPGQVDLGTTTQPFSDPAPHLPLFRITCTGAPHPHYGRVILTNDPGYALTTGRCADVGKITLQSLRGLAARAPYFSNGSANTLMDVIDYYDRRYDIHFTDQEKQDLVNLLSVL
jgi:hypothetical protein